MITNHSQWIAFLEGEGYLSNSSMLEGFLFPGGGVKPRTINPADFSENYIIAAMMGLRGFTEGPEIEITDTRRINNIVNVTVRMYDPHAGAAALSSPYHIVIVKREFLPKGNATFVFKDTEGKELGRVEIKPAINLTYVPTRVTGNTNFTVRWLVSGGSEGDINYTAIHWGYKSTSANISDYPGSGKIQTGKTPMEFTEELYAPGGGNFYIRAHAVVDGVDAYSPEYQVIIDTSKSAGGRY